MKKFSFLIVLFVFIAEINGSGQNIKTVAHTLDIYKRSLKETVVGEWNPLFEKKATGLKVDIEWFKTNKITVAAVPKIIYNVNTTPDMSEEEDGTYISFESVDNNDIPCLVDQVVFKKPKKINGVDVDGFLYVTYKKQFELCYVLKIGFEVD